MKTRLQPTFNSAHKLDFAPDFGFGGGVLLGQNGFMSRFKTTFVQPENFFEIEPFKLFAVA
jgi:hypothetical protein